MKSFLALLSLAGSLAAVAAPHRASERYLDTGWEFSRDKEPFRRVRLPHDWGQELPTDRRVTGMQGMMTFFGTAVYRTSFETTPDERYSPCYLDFDGVMGDCTVLVNGQRVGENHYGYMSFRADATRAIDRGKSRQEVEVRVDNSWAAGRWYQGGGLYRRVRLGFASGALRVAHDGLAVTTRLVPGGSARVRVEVAVEGRLSPNTADNSVVARLFRRGSKVLLAESPCQPLPRRSWTFAHEFEVREPALWSPETPELYEIELTTATKGGGRPDVYRDTFGIRDVRFCPKEGMFVNGRHVKMRGVCQHSDSGALGAAAWTRTLRRQVEILKSFGANAIRTTHNPPSPELLDICDELGMYVVDEAFDMWEMFKGGNDSYAKHFPVKALDDLMRFVRRDRNHPSVVMWSIGNEVGEQWDPERGVPVGKALTAVCHMVDPSRPVTMGNDFPGTMTNGLAAAVDVFGWNYKPHLYGEFRQRHPDMGYWGSETESMVSTRGFYHFPKEGFPKTGKNPPKQPYKAGYVDNQVSSYDLYAMRPTNYPPETEFAAQKAHPECFGQFVWTGFDYLGEPSPWEKTARSSYYGIVDLCGFPKDRYYCYQAEWCPEKPIVHALPHWTWPGREGQVTPVHVYTSGDEAEVFVNGRSQGRKRKGETWRLIWDDVRYQPGELKVVAYRQGRVWAESVTRTAGAPARLEVTADTRSLSSMTDLAYVTVSLRDKDGNLVPNEDLSVTYEATGSVEAAGFANGDPTDLAGMSNPKQRTFHGLAQAVLRRREGVSGPGRLVVTAENGLTAALDFNREDPSSRQRLFTMRFDDNHSPAQWKQVADAFERHGLRASFAVTAAGLSDEQGACLAELARRGHEIMDHTPQHAIYRQVFNDDASFAARTNRPYVAAWDVKARRIYCKAEIDWKHRSAFRFKGAIRDGEVVVRDPAALKRLHFSAKFYVPSVDRWFGVRQLDGDRRLILDFWGRDVKDVVVPETEMVTLFQDAIQPSDELLRDQCLTTRKVFERYGIPRPTCWIQPGGWESFLSSMVLQRVCGDGLGYFAADAVVGPATASNAWVLRPDFAYLDEGNALEAVKKRVTDALAKRRQFIYISHMNGARAGGWDKWLADTEAFAAWLASSDINVVTYSEQARRLFGKDK